MIGFEDKHKSSREQVLESTIMSNMKSLSYATNFNSIPNDLTKYILVIWPSVWLWLMACVLKCSRHFLFSA